MERNDLEGEAWITAVENISYATGYKFLALLILADLLYRVWALGEPVWDMIAAVLSSAMLITMYQAKYRVLNRRWVHFALLLLMIMAAISALIFYAM